ncbi:MAG: 30S ribosomal protein S8 [Patescibacteria group bacterium]
MNDKVADMLNRIYTNTLVGKDTVSFPATKLTESITEVLRSEGFISAFALNKNNKKAGKNIEVEIRYREENGKDPVMKGFSRISKPSCRVYLGVSDIKNGKDALSTRVISTPKGVLTHKQAIKEGVGGEILFDIW